MDNFLDILISILQSLLFVYIISYCLDINIKKNKIRLLSCLILFSSIAIIVPRISDSIIFNVFSTHIFSLLIVYIFFKKKFINAFVSYSLIYLILAVWVFVFGNIFDGILQKTLVNKNMEAISDLLLYVLQVPLLILWYLLRLQIKQIYKLVLSINTSIILIGIFSFIPDFLLSSYCMLYFKDGSILKNIVPIFFILFVIFNIYTFRKIERRYIEVNNLNKTLALKNDELKSIKGEYGLQMNCLYDLCNMEKYSDVKDILVGIINNKEHTRIPENNLSLLFLATKHAKSETLKVIVEDTADFKLVNINEIELYRIIINIVNNAIRAMKNKGTLIVRSFQDLKNIIITIENDGEKIPEGIIDKIFDSGFTTKNNKDEGHGYGLSIAKELIEKHYGKIFVESENSKTVFTIKLPKSKEMNYKEIV